MISKQVLFMNHVQWLLQLYSCAVSHISLFFIIIIIIIYCYLFLILIITGEQ